MPNKKEKIRCTPNSLRRDGDCPLSVYWLFLVPRDTDGRKLIRLFSVRLSYGFYPLSEIKLEKQERIEKSLLESWDLYAESL